MGQGENTGMRLQQPPLREPPSDGVPVHPAGEIGPPEHTLRAEEGDQVVGHAARLADGGPGMGVVGRLWNTRQPVDERRCVPTAQNSPANAPLTCSAAVRPPG